ncbi:MAG: pyrroline-5-carboxylate reductase [Gammaproteobacteria bacterium]|nr:pyrroline-5-carboxylate reductase [Gammaproteobacteria bacterium]
MQNKNITFIGSGHIAQSLIVGLINSNFAPKNIWATGINTNKLSQLAATYKINTTSDNAAAAKQADIIILAVAPQLVKTIASEIHDHIQTKDPIIISLAAGINYKELQNLFMPHSKIILAMPNTPTAVNAGVTALFTPSNNEDNTLTIATKLFQLVGQTVQLASEKLFNIVTVLSGCGPAYFYLMMEALQEAAMDMGLDTETARTLTVQTAMGAAKMATINQKPLSKLRQDVSPPGGVTEQAILSLKQNNIEKIFAEALSAAKQKLSS